MQQINFHGDHRLYVGYQDRSQAPVQRCSKEKMFPKTCSKFIEITLWCSPVNLLQIFRTPFPKNTNLWAAAFVSSNQCKLSK